MMRTCRDCRHSYRAGPNPNYLRCRQSGHEDNEDASLAGEMRKGACGPEGKLWEARDGQA